MGNFSIPLSGLGADSTALNTIGNNLANINTVGYKGQTTEFETLFSQQLGESGSGDPIQVGAGTRVSGTTTDFSQGTPTPDSSSNTSDMALDGNGFFIVNQNGQQELTRAGNFTVANNGGLTTQDGASVMGYPAANGVVNTNTNLQAIMLPVGSTEGAQATQNISVTANLNSNAAVGDTFTTPLALNDSLGQTQNATITYTKTATNTWNYTVTLASGASTGAPIGNTGTLTFDSSGNLIEPTAATWPAGKPVTVGTTIVDSNGNIEKAIAVAGTGTTGATIPTFSTVVGGVTVDNPGTNQVVWTNLGTPSSVSSPITFPGMADGASSLSFNWNLNGGGAGATISQEASANTNGAVTQDGFPSGNYTGFRVDQNGVIQAQFSNGNSQTIGQVAIANVANVEGLVSVGGNNFETTGASGEAVAGVANTGGRGNVQDSALESSNVDISTEFANLIVAQRAFEANSKTVTTFDTISQDVIGMVR